MKKKQNITIKNGGNVKTNRMREVGRKGAQKGGVSAGDVHGKLDLDKSDQAFRMVRIHSVSSNFFASEIIELTIISRYSTRKERRAANKPRRRIPIGRLRVSWAMEEALRRRRRAGTDAVDEEDNCGPADGGDGKGGHGRGALCQRVAGKELRRDRNLDRGTR